ncbi:MAG: DUF5655 domain-containing protein [Kineosporiaceae bacterium]
MSAAGDSGPGAEWPDAPDPAGASRPPLWECARCGRAFANRNQSHACGRFDLGPLFARSDPVVRETFDAVVRAARRHGPLTVVPEKTRVALQVRMSFAALTPRRHWLDGHVVLARAVPHPRFRTIQTISPRNHVHVFRLRTPADVDAEVETWLAEAYEVGAQRHLGQP